MNIYRLHFYEKHTFCLLILFSLTPSKYPQILHQIFFSSAWIPTQSLNVKTLNMYNLYKYYNQSYFHKDYTWVLFTLHTQHYTYTKLIFKRSVSSLIAHPEKYAGDPAVGKGFMLQCSLYFAGYEGVQNCSIHLLTDKALAWTTAVWSKGVDHIVYYERFLQLFQRVFNLSIHLRARRFKSDSLPWSKGSKALLNSHSAFTH